MDIFSVTDSIANIFLVVNHTYVMLAIGAIGLVLYDRTMFGRALVLLAFAFIFKGYLKDLWQLPLPPEVDQPGVINWAFPSGHTVTMIAFFGWLACEIKNSKVRFFLVNLMWFVMLFTIYRGYHQAIDILGGIVFGCLVLVASGVALRFRLFQNSLCAYAILFLVPAFCMAFSSDGARIANDTWLGLGLLGGIAVGSFFHFDYIKVRDPLALLVIAIGNILFVAFVVYAQKPLVGIVPPLVLKMITHFIVFFWITNEALTAAYFKGFSNMLRKRSI